MDADQSGLTSYYHHHHPSSTAAAANGIFSDPHHPQSTPPLTYPPQHSLSNRTPPPTTSAATPPPPPPPPPQPETLKRKRGRPRKYGNPDATQGATPSVSAAKKVSPTTTSLPLSSPAGIPSSKKNQIFSLGNAGQNFTPHIINVTAGEDVAQKIMLFIQRSKRAVCILSASGSISNASLRQPATSGGNVTYEGRFEILSLSGSFLHTETEGGSSRTGGISVCLSGTDGVIVGGGVVGPLKAAGPVQVVVGSFMVETNKETNVNTIRLPQGMGQTFSNVTYHSHDSTGMTPGRANNDHQNIGVNSFMLHSQGMHSMPSQSTDWRDNQVLTDHGGCQSSEDGDNRNFQH